MNKPKKLTLIEGKFTHEEAREVLINIFTAKIHFHKLKNFSSQERLGKNDEDSLRRISELKNSIQQLNEVLSEAESSKKKLIITSEIIISLSE